MGRYLVADVIGEGGMGRIYRAYDPELNRPVALKLFRALRSEERQQKRLLREAQALAHVVHPNVVYVFDVGEFTGQVFFAMELVEGTTLRAELGHAKPDRRHLLRLIDQAGRGLAAAHRAGLAHRDFKPENVLIDRNGQVKVADFGLARAIVDAKDSEDPARVPSDPPARALELPVTEAGALVGTPGYMAPEQYEGHAADARSDQFSFAIVAYEALFGRHPFSNKAGKFSMDALRAGRIEVPGRRLDIDYLRVLGRGLSRDPANRYPSLQHLLDELADVPRRRRRRTLVIAAIACAGMGLLGWPAIRNHRAQRCDTAATQALAGIWDAPRRAQVETVLTGDGKAFGRDVWKRVAATLDVYADQWKHTKVELCRSAEWWRAEDATKHTRASSCLDERRRELRAVTDVLAGGDRDVRLRAPDILIQLDALSSCTNAAALSLAPWPTYGEAAAVEVEPIRDLLAQSRARFDADQLAPAEEAARRALDLARKQQDRALAAEALYRLGIAQTGGGKYDAARASIVQALADAESSGRERLLPLIWSRLIVIDGKVRPDTVEPLVPFIEATVERLDPQGPAHIELLRTLGLLENARGRYDRAIARFNAALDMARGVFGENDIRRVVIYRQLANAERSINRRDEAITHLHSALREAEALFGNDHPQLMMTLSTLARTMSEQRDRAGLQAMGQRVLQIVEQAASPESQDVGYSLFELGMAYLDDAQPEVALPLLRRSYAMDTPNSRGSATSLSGIARAEEALGHLEAARAVLDEALTLNRRLAGPGDPSTILYGVRLGRILRKQHRERDAQQLCAELLDAGERTLGPRGVYVALALSCVGESYEQLGRFSEALAALERAEKLVQDGTTTPRHEFRATIGFALARVLWRTGGDRERARRLANEAIDGYEHSGRAYVQDGAEVQAWLAAVSAQHR
ncbi:protein kinase domain-containing protein [Pendulispora albinea]|uniref:Serine/threonine-protein kinase n=1 Tax=Pendulispora albinea TaxID=2741071 RepID=A0ABZ2LQD3_9BACT